MNSTELNDWLIVATRHLAKDSAAQVRAEIGEHYESAREAAILAGVAGTEAGAVALKALGDAKTANCHYRRVLLTAEEARMLRDGEWEARVFCCRRRLIRVGISAIAAGAPAAFFFAGRFDAARDTLIAAAFMITFLMAPLFLPIYTPARSLVFRIAKWMAFTGVLLCLFSPNLLSWFWLPASCLSTVAWIEWKRASIRRKLPVAAWPKHLFL